MLRVASSVATELMDGCSMPAPAPCASTKHAVAPGGSWSNAETRRVSSIAMVSRSATPAFTGPPRQKVSDQAHENARELIGLVDHDVVAAINGVGFPGCVTSNPFERAGEPRKFLCADIGLPGDPLVSTREFDLLGEAGSRLRRHLAVYPGSISLIDGEARGRDWRSERARINLSAEVADGLSVRRDERIQIDDRSNLRRDLLGDARDHHSAIGMADEHHVLEILPSNLVHDIADLRRQIDAR